MTVAYKVMDKGGCSSPRSCAVKGYCLRHIISTAGPGEIVEVPGVSGTADFTAPRIAATAGSVCSVASGLVGGDRAKTHGDKVENHANIAALWSGFLGIPLSPLQVSLMMVLLKVARTKAGAHNLDDYVDMAGYAGVSGEIAERGGDRIVPKGMT